MKKDMRVFGTFVGGEGGVTAAADGLRALLSTAKKKSPRLSLDNRGLRRTAATYSPNWWVSTIGDGELNFSVRNGKRWILTAITTAVYYLREKSNSENLPVHWNNSQIFSLLLGLSFS